MLQPLGFADGTNHICKLKKAIYGLCQAARQFYIRLDEILTEIGYVRVGIDWALWLGKDGSCIASHVDDMAACGSPEQLDSAADHIRKYLDLKDFGEISRYLGINITRRGNDYLLSQDHYIESLLEEYDMVQCHLVSTPMLSLDSLKDSESDSGLLDDNLKKKYQSLVGSLLYLVHGTRPDISFSVIRLSQYSSKPRMVHWIALKRILRYLKGTIKACLIIKYDERQAGLIGYFDAAHADNDNRRSTCGYLFLLNSSPISWATKVQRTVALSTTEAEFMSGTEDTKEAMFIQQITSALFQHHPLPPAELRGDNQGALALATNPVFHPRTKHIDIRQRYISDMVNKKAITVKYVSSHDMLADGLTKPLMKERFLIHLKQMGLILDVSGSQSAMVMSVTNSSALKRRFVECDVCENIFRNDIALSQHR